VLRLVKMPMTNGMTAPAIRPCTTGPGIQAASLLVSPRADVISRIAPASMAAPASSENANRSPREAKKIRAKTFPVRSSGIRYRRVSTRLGIIGRP
jgi:hypothetical protein